MSILRALRLLQYAIPAGLLLPCQAQGQWLPQGIPICTEPVTQRDPGVIPDGSGGALIFWIDQRGGHDVYAQRVTADGRIAPGWPSNGVTLGGQAGGYPPAGIADGTGGAIIVWEDTRTVQTSLHDLYAQRVTGAGTIAPGWPLEGFPVCTSPDDQLGPQLISDGTGGVIIAWQDNRNDPGGPFPSPDIYAQRVTGNGEIPPGWPVNGIPICTTPETQGNPTLASDEAGGAVISWADGRSLATTGADIYAQRVSASGEIAPGWIADGIAVSTAPGHQHNPKTVADAQGGALVTWLDGRTDPDWDIYAQRITGSGAMASGWPAEGVALSTARGYQYFLSVAADGQGGALVTWEDYTEPSASDIFAQKVTAAGGISAGWPPNGVPVCSAPGYQLNPRLAPDGTGGAFVVWEDTRAGTNEDVYAQHVTASGGVALGWEPNGVAISTAPASQPRPAVASDGFGGAIMAWSDLRNGNKDIFAHNLAPDGPVPALLSLTSAETTAERVVLLWYGRDAASLAVVVHRRTPSRDWEAIGSPVSESPDRLRYEDRSIVPGTRYAYRLAYRDAGGDQFTAETWVEVPALVLSLVGFQPNPARGRPIIRLALPSAEPASLVALDVRGRIVWARDVGFLGLGSHALDLDIAGRLMPGIYWLRLSQAGRVVTARGLVLP